MTDLYRNGRRLRLWSRVIGIAAMTLTTLACDSDRTLGEDEVARIGEESITVAEFEQEMQRLGGNVPGQFRTPDQRRALLDAMVEEEQLVQTALAQGIDRDPEVRRAYRRMLTNRLRNQQLEEKLGAVQVSDAEVRSHYEANAERYQRPERRRAAIIYAAPGDRDATVQRLEEVRRQAAEMSDVTHFGHLALEHSEDQASRYVGGSIGWLSRDVPERYKWGMEVHSALFSLAEVGDVSEVIETESGYYLVRLMTVDGASDRAYEDLAPGIRRALLSEKQRELRKQLLNELSGDVEVRVNEQALSEAQPPNTTRVADGKQPPALPQRTDGDSS